jgi:DNA (cytosine-5)-methyltransferase 1
MMQPVAIDLFCKAGGATKGLQQAGFYVIGVDIDPQPNYCGDEFIQMDALHLDLADVYGLDFIWASPPCQAYTRQGKPGRHPELIEPVRDRLKASGVPYVIENVVGAPLIDPIILCGSMFGLGVRRHRKFEASFEIGLTPPCRHEGHDIRAYYGAWGREAYRAKKPGLKDTLRGTVDRAPQDMGIDWMNWRELTQAIPPAYSEFIGRAALSHIHSAAFPRQRDCAVPPTAPVCRNGECGVSVPELAAEAW